MRNMKTLSTRIIYEVPVGPAIRWHVNVAGELGSCSGKVWLTRERDPADYWLEHSSPLRVRPGDVLWIGVDDDTPGQVELRFEAHARPSWLASLGLWLSSDRRDDRGAAVLRADATSRAAGAAGAVGACAGALSARR